MSEEELDKTFEKALTEIKEKEDEIEIGRVAEDELNKDIFDDAAGDLGKKKSSKKSKAEEWTRKYVPMPVCDKKTIYENMRRLNKKQRQVVMHILTADAISYLFGRFCRCWKKFCNRSFVPFDN